MSYTIQPQRCTSGWEVLQNPRYWTADNKFDGAIDQAMAEVGDVCREFITDAEAYYDEHYCTCPVEHDDNEIAFNKCSACGKRRRKPMSNIPVSETKYEGLLLMLEDTDGSAGHVDRLRIAAASAITALIHERDQLRADNAALAKDAARLDWCEQELFDGKWDGTIGRPKEWYMAGPYRHTMQRMKGNTLRAAIDKAMESAQ